MIGRKIIDYVKLKIIGDLPESGPGVFDGEREDFDEDREMTREELVHELKRHILRCGQYFSAVQKLEKQRDEWREWFHEQGRAHVAAQIMLEAEIIKNRRAVKMLLTEVNRLRKENGDDLYEINHLAEETAKPVGAAKEYLDQIRSMHADYTPLSAAQIIQETASEIDATL